MIKPLGILHALSDIMHVLQEIGHEEFGRFTVVHRTLIELHYSEHRGREFYPALVDYFSGKSVLAMILSGDEIIHRVRERIGPSNPREAVPGQLRRLVLERFPDNTNGWVNCETLTHKIDNFIHASDSEEAAEREIKLWAPYLLR